MARTRFTKANWAKLALALLAKHGARGVTVEALCKAAGRTRGSLYHHFKGHDALLQGMLEYWVETHTDAVIAKVETQDGKKAHALSELANALDFDVEVGVRRLVAHHAALRPIVHDVDARRIAYLEALHRRSGLSADDAYVVAELEYAAYVGFQHMADGRDQAELPALYAKLEKMISRLAAQTTEV